MRFEKKEMDLFSEVSLCWNFGELVTTFQNFCKNILDLAYDLAYTDFDSLSNAEFYSLIKRAYKLYFTEKDYLNVLTYRNHKNYQFMEFGTNMSFTAYANEGRGYSFDYWKQLYQRRYLAAIALTVQFENKDLVPISLLKDLLVSKDVVLIKEKDKKISEEEDLRFFNEEIQSFPLTPIHKLEASSMNPNGEDFDYFIARLRKKFFKRKVLADVKEMLFEFENDVHAFLQNPNFLIAFEDEMRIIRDWYEGSIEKQKLARISKSLK